MHILRYRNFKFTIQPRRVSSILTFLDGTIESIFYNLLRQNNNIALERTKYYSKTLSVCNSTQRAVDGIYESSI